jgi:lipase
MDRPFHTELDVPVRGGHLRVGLAGPAGGVPLVLAVHGITGSHRTWSAVARHLGQDVTLVAPDLRGRGGSSNLPGPFGFAAHLEDLVAVLDHVGALGATLAGHSMGAYLVARLAAAHPSRIQAVVLVDGGLPLPVPDGVDPDELLEAVLGPSVARLRMTFSSKEAYRDFWRAHPALAGPKAWSADIEDFVDYDLGEAVGGGEVRSRVSEQAVREDSRELLDVEAVRRAVLALGGPAVLVRAPRGLQDEERPLLAEEAVAEAREALPHLVDVTVPDTNHYLVLLGEREAAVVADQIRSAAGI